MSLLIHDLLMASGTVVPPPPSLEAAALLGTGSAVDLAATVTLDAAVAVSTGDYLVCLFGSRHGVTSREHLSLVPTTWACAFAKSAVDEEVIDTPTSEYMRLSIWTGVVSSGGTGTLTGTTTANTFQRGLILLRVPGGDSIAQTAAGGGSTGTGDSVAWNAAPNAAGLSVAGGIYEGNTSSPALAGHTEIAGSAITGNVNFQMRAWQKLLSPPNPLVFSGAVDGRRRALGALNILGA